MKAPNATSVHTTGRTTPWKWVLLCASAPAVWGTTYVVTTELLPAGYPVWSSALRALPAGIIGLLICRQLPWGEWWWKSLVMGLLNMGMFFPLLFISAYRLPGGLASVLIACQPLFVAALGYLILKEAPTIWRIVWGLIGIAGIAMMVLDSDAVVDTWGIVAGIIGAGSMAAGIVLFKKWHRPVGGLTWASWLLAWAGVMLIPASFLFEGGPPPIDASAGLGYAWLGIVGALLTYWAWFGGLGKLPVSAASFLPLLSPIVATLLGIILLQQFLGVVQWIGFTICLLAIVCAQLPPPARTSKKEQVPKTRS